MYTNYKLDSFSSVAANETANVALPVGPTYESIHLQLGGTSFDKSHVDRVTLNLNGDDIVDVTGADLSAMFRYEHTEDAAFLSIPLSDFEAKADAGQALTGLVTMPGDTLVLNVQIGAATAPTLKGWAYTSAARPMREVIPRLKKISWTPGATGEQDFTTFPRGPRVKRLFIGGGTAVIDDLKIFRDDIKIYDRPSTVNSFELQKVFKKNAISGYHVVDPVADGFMLKNMMITQSQSFVVKANVTTAGSLPILAWTLEADKTASLVQAQDASGGQKRTRRGRRG